MIHGSELKMYAWPQFRLRFALLPWNQTNYIINTCKQKFLGWTHDSEVWAA